MEKKNPYKFTLGFDKTKPSHVRATEILNSVKDKADLIASALVSYIDDVRQEECSFSFNAERSSRNVRRAIWRSSSEQVCSSFMI